MDYYSAVKNNVRRIFNGMATCQKIRKLKILCTLWFKFHYTHRRMYDLTQHMHNTHSTHIHMQTHMHTHAYKGQNKTRNNDFLWVVGLLLLFSFSSFYLPVLSKIFTKKLVLFFIK